MRQFRISNKGFIRGIEENERLVGLRIINPCLKLFTCGSRACRIVREAEVDEVNRLRRQLRDKSIRLRTVQIDKPFVTPLGVLPCTAGHDVGIHIDRVNGIGNGNRQLIGEQLLNIGGIALRTVAHKDLIGRHICSAGLKIIDRKCLAQEVIPLLRTIPAEGRARGHLIDCLVQGLNTRRRQRLRDIADPQTNDLLFRMFRLVRLNTL